MSAKVQAAVVIGALVMLGGAPLSAQAYRCTVKETGGSTGWIAPEMIFGIDQGGGVQVNDGIIQTVNGGPMDAKVSSDNETRIVFTWSLDMTNADVQSTRMAYRATFDRATQKIRVAAKPAGYANDFEGRGTCQPE